MADLLTLGLRVDASGALVPIEQTKRSFESLGNSAFSVQGRIKGFATNSAFALSSLASSGTADITSVLKSFSSLGFAMGAGAGTVALAVSAIADAWGEARRKAKAEQDQMLADLKSFESKLKGEALAVQIAAIERRDAEFVADIADIERALANRKASAKQTNRRADFDAIVLLQEELDLIEKQRAAYGAMARLAPLRVQQAKQERDRIAEAAAEAKRLAEARQKMLDEGDRAQFDADTDVKNQFEAELAHAKKLEDFDKRFFEERQRLRDADAEHAKKLAEEEEERLKRQRDLLRGILVGAGTGLLRQFGGAAGGVMAGGIEAGIGAAATGAGPFGIAAASVVALTKGIFGLGQASKESAQRTQEFIQAQKVAAGLVTQEQLESEATAAAYARELQKLAVEQRALAEFIRETGDATGLFAKSLEDSKRRTQELLDLQQLMEAKRTQEVADRNLEMQQDLEVRRLRALGRDEEAEAMALAIAHERELAQATEDRATAVTLAALAEVQRVEKLNLAIQAHEQQIASFTATIGGLQAFRNTLLLAETQSPTERLAEARRQYAEILGTARGDDMAAAQEAAGRLPQAAQTLLDLSRLVNASGSGFQSDRDQILADNQALINRFTDLRSIEQLMLDELMAIRDNTGAVALRLGDATTGPVGTLPVGTTGNTPGGHLDPTVAANTAAQVEVSADGFRQTVQELEGVRLEIIELRSAFRLLSDAIGASRN